MRKVFISLLLVISIASCNKAQEQPDTNVQQEHVDWELGTATYDAEQVGEVEKDSIYNGPTEWIWDGSRFDTLYPGATLRMSLT